MSDDERGFEFTLVVIAGDLVFGSGLVVNNMTRSEVVLDLLQFDDLGLVFVMGGAAVVTGTVFALAEAFGDRTPLTGYNYGHRLKSFNKSVVVGRVVFGAGWGTSGVCPGTAYANLGVGNYPVLIVIGGMFVGMCLQGFWRTRHTKSTVTGTSAD